LGCGGKPKQIPPRSTSFLPNDRIRKFDSRPAGRCSTIAARACEDGAEIPEEGSMDLKRLAACAAIAGAMLAGCATQSNQDTKPGAPPAATKPAAAYAVIPPKKDTDLKLYYADGRIVTGTAALGRMQQDAELILWLAGNQFFAMDDVVRAFQSQNRGTDVGLITLPPGLLLSAIEKGGWVYEGKPYPGRPDVYSSVNLGHLKKLQQQGLMRDYAIHMHKEMVLLVAKAIRRTSGGIPDLPRRALRCRTR
jgi:hypothetical protein